MRQAYPIAASNHRIRSSPASLFLNANARSGKAYAARYHEKGGRYFCQRCSPPEGKTVTTEFDLDRAFRKQFDKLEVPPITSFGIQMNTKDTEGGARAYLKRVEFIARRGPAVCCWIGRQMDRSDRQHTRDVLKNNRTGQTLDWVNPATGRRYAVTPQETFSQAGNQPCREFVISSGSGAQARRSTETACRRPDGGWEIRD